MEGQATRPYALQASRPRRHDGRRRPRGHPNRRYPRRPRPARALGRRGGRELAGTDRRRVHDRPLSPRLGPQGRDVPRGRRERGVVDLHRPRPGRVCRRRVQSRGLSALFGSGPLCPVGAGRPDAPALPGAGAGRAGDDAGRVVDERGVGSVCGPGQGRGDALAGRASDGAEAVAAPGPRQDPARPRRARPPRCRPTRPRHGSVVVRWPGLACHVSPRWRREPTSPAASGRL